MTHQPSDTRSRPGEKGSQRRSVRSPARTGIGNRKACRAVGARCVKGEGGVTEPPTQGGIGIGVVGGEEVVPIAGRRRNRGHQQAVAGAAVDADSDRVASQQQRVHRHRPIAGQTVTNRGGTGHNPIRPPPVSREIESAWFRHRCTAPPRPLPAGRRGR